MATDHKRPSAPARPERRVLAALFVTAAAGIAVWEFFAAVLPPAQTPLPLYLDEGRTFLIQHPYPSLLAPLSVWLMLGGIKLKLWLVKALSGIKGKSLFFKLLLGLLLLGSGLIIGCNVPPATKEIVFTHIVYDCDDGHCNEYLLPQSAPPEDTEPPPGDRVSALPPGASWHRA